MTKKILIAIPCLLTGGTEIQSFLLTKALIQGNYSVKVLCYFEYDLNILELFINEGAEIILLSKEDSSRPHGFRLLLFLFKHFRNTIRNYSPDVVHIQYMTPGTSAIILFRLLGIKNIIATLHTQGEIYHNRIWTVRFITNWFLKYLICVSKTTEESIFGNSLFFAKNSFTQNRRHYTIYNTIEIPSVKKKSRLLPEKKNEKTFRIGIASRLSYIKGIDTLLNTFMLVHSQYNDAELFIAGDGIEKKKLLQLSEDLGIFYYVNWLGTLEPEDVFTFYNEVDLVVIPSRSEGFGLSAIEAMAMEKPIVASDTGGLREIIDHSCGILVPVEDSDSMAESIIYLLKNPKLISKMGKAGKEKVERLFSFDNYKENILNLYNTLVNKK